MGIPEDLEFRLFGHSLGTWFWVANSQSLHPVKRMRWNPRPGTHPFVLISDYTGGPAATVRARSKSSTQGIQHNAHPRGHSRTCKIREPGHIVEPLWSLGPAALCAENYSCQEPYEEILAKLRNRAEG
jgi:hypothetical protein